MSEQPGDAGGGLVVYPRPSPDLARLLDLSGRAWCAVADDLEARNVAGEPQGAIVELVDRGSGPAGDGYATDPAWAVLEALGRREPPLCAVLVLVGGSRLGELVGRDELFADFCLTPFHPAEVEARLTHLLSSSSSTSARSVGAPSGGAGNGADADSQELVHYGDLLLNTHSYQARIAGRALDLTYMEYELLAFLAQNPDRVHSREVLLSRVWGYDYYGGARTVDVHIRRLRSKLGEEHARLIQTVRSVGYRLGRVEPDPDRWIDPGPQR